MNRFAIYISVWIAVFGIATAQAGDIDTMLFGPAKKITASPKENPLIPRIETIEKDKKTPEAKPTTISKAEKSVENEVTPLTPVKKAENKKSKEKSLTEEIKEISEKDKDENQGKDSILKDTWVEKLGNSLSKNAKSSDDDNNKEANFENMMHGVGKSGRSNASVFDISGVMLRMTLNQAESALLKRGYKMVAQKFEIPNFIKWRYEEQCRNSGVVGYERLNSCVVKAAQASNHQYVSTSKFAKYDSQEEITIWLTSNFTNNKVYKIAYMTGITKVNQGSGQKSQYLHNVKTYEFWRRINQKYGNPDNRNEILWGLGGNKPYMRAVTGKLLLEDPMLRELDYTRMSREDQKFMNTNLYNF